MYLLVDCAYFISLLLLWRDFPYGDLSFVAQPWRKTYPECTFHVFG